MIQKRISEELSLPEKQVSSVLKLIAEGATIPFMARYRKEQTGGLDEVDLEKITLSLKKWEEFDKRKAYILEKLAELRIENSILLSKIQDCQDPKLLEDLFLPYKQKRKTKATVAKELGLEPFAKMIMAQRSNDLFAQAERFVRRDLNIDEVFQGARDIIAEWISESLASRDILRTIFQKSGAISAKVVSEKEQEADNFRDYFQYKKKINKILSHQLLALLRAEKLGFLKLKFEYDKDYAFDRLSRVFIKSEGPAAEHISLALKDSQRRLLAPSIESEIKIAIKTKADEEAIKIFSHNVSQLLLECPLGNKPVMAIDPGFRTGCKVVCLDQLGNLMHSTTIFPLDPHNQKNDALIKIKKWIATYQIQAIAIGDGTGGRDTDLWLRAALKDEKKIQIFLLSEAGASIYSASEVAREEFPDLDITYRGAISIGRRLIDPLAELVKIEPKHIGVGQYQHDVNQQRLKESLDNVVLFAVNKVGVNLNTASKHLLQYVSGLGSKLAENIVEQRNSKGNFKTREELMAVKGFGAKAYQQASGFLRIKEGENPLDMTAIHPERYPIVQKMAKALSVPIQELIQNEDHIKRIDAKQYINEEVGTATIKDILNELKKPGIDPRGVAEAMHFDTRLQNFEDLNVGMFLQGKINNLTKFGAFVDVGIKENGLIHLSEICDEVIKDPAEKLSIGQKVWVRVVDIDIERKRISLSMRGNI